MLVVERTNAVTQACKLAFKISQFGAFERSELQGASRLSVTLAEESQLFFNLPVTPLKVGVARVLAHVLPGRSMSYLGSLGT